MSKAVLFSHFKTIYEKAIQAVAPPTLMATALTFDPSSRVLRVSGTEYQLNHNVKVVAFGKAVLGMVAGLECVLGDHITEGVASVPVGALETARRNHPTHIPKQGRVKICEGAAQNLPDSSAHHTAQEILSVAERAGEEDVVIALISGGGSSLLPCPVEGVTLQEKRQVVEAVSKAGATIQELNIVRKSLSTTKGGKLALAAYPAKVVALILSDVVGDPLDVIASGPTVPNLASKAEALHIVSKFSGLREQIPPSVWQHLNKQHSPERSSSLVMKDGCISYQHVQNVIVGSNRIATAAAQKAAEELGYRCLVWSHCIQGEARLLGKVYAKIAGSILCSYKTLPLDLAGLLSEDSSSHLLQQSPELCADLSRLVKELPLLCPPLCLIGSGEPTVNVHGSGRGGRNQELALSFGIEIHKLVNDTSVSSERPAADCTLVSVGTDGQDGPCDAAGAMADCTMVSCAEDQGLIPDSYLENNDSYTFFSKFSGGSHLIQTGLTGTNVMDLHLLVL